MEKRILLISWLRILVKSYSIVSIYLLTWKYSKSICLCFCHLTADILSEEKCRKAFCLLSICTMINNTVINGKFYFEFNTTTTCYTSLTLLSSPLQNLLLVSGCQLSTLHHAAVHYVHPTIVIVVVIIICHSTSVFPLMNNVLDLTKIWNSHWRERDDAAVNT